MSNYIFSPSPSYGISEHDFVTWENGFTENELDQIITYCDALPRKTATISGDQQDPNIRTSKVSWVGLTADSQWIYDKLAWILRNLNGQFYKFDIYGFSEDLQYTIYDENDQSHYTWHIDRGSNPENPGQPPRKLSMVLQLTDPADYDGGALEIWTGKEPLEITKQRGLVAVFPSFILHRVTPVTRGVRKTIVVWATGPAFK